MKVSIFLLIVILCIFSLSVHAVNPGRIYYNESNNNFQYIIMKGDTFYDISRQFNISLTSLKKLNNELDPKSLQIGTKVNIGINKDLNYYVVKSGDTISEITQGINLTVRDITAYNKIKNPDKILPGEVLLLPEVIESNENIKIMQFQKTNGVIYISGVARVFEATVNYALETNYGKVLNKGFTMAAIGAPQWGKFDFNIFQIPNEAQYIVIYTISARDGSRQNDIKLKL